MWMVYAFLSVVQSRRALDSRMGPHVTGYVCPIRL